MPLWESGASVCDRIGHTADLFVVRTDCKPLSPVAKIYLFASAVLINLVSLLASFHYYRRYYVRMKTRHWPEWSELMKKDEVVANLGEWYRWPFGSIYLIGTYLRRNVDFGDAELRSFKEKGRVAGYVFACSFLILFVLVLVLPK